MSGPAGAVFNSAGQISTEYVPGVYSRVNTVLGSAGFSSFQNCVIMGEGYGPKPQTLVQFNTIPQALNTLVGGPLLDAIRLAFSPGANVTPQQLYIMCVNSSLNATSYLVSGANNIIELSTKTYGVQANQVTHLLSGGTTTGKKLVLTYKTQTETYDNLDQQLMTLECTDSSSTAATVTIVNSSAAQTLTTAITGGTTAALNINLANYTSIGDVVAYINNQSGYTATVGAGYTNTSINELDQVSAVSILGTAATLHGIEYAIINAVNQGSQIATAADVSAANGIQPPSNDSATTYFSGGSNGTYQATDWTSALTALEAENVQLIATPDPTVSVMSAISDHCTFMSSTNQRKERQFVVGGAIGDSTTTAITNSQTLNNYLGMYVFNGGYQFNSSGVLTEYGASYVACMIAAIKSAVSINVPLTRKTLNLVSLEQKINQTDLQTLIQGAVAPVSYNVSGVANVVRQVTTYQAADLIYNEFSMVTEANFVQYDLRNYLDPLFIGNPAIKTMLGTLKGAVQARLNSYVDNLGIITTDANGRTWWNLTISISGDVANVDFDANLTAPMNFTFITGHLHTSTSGAA